MRLTLRTMLAYLDDILEPDDAEDIGKKITESDFASSLVHRTRDCVRRMRLGTPAVMGKGLGGDPNSVAEYLDNTLEGDRVPEFEKVCLESDVQLAEVASCHQILTLVLGEPAEIDPGSRERMYQIANRADEPAVVEKPPQAVAAHKVHRTPSPSDTPEILPGTGKRHRPEVPDYLRDTSRSRKWPIISTIAVAAVVTLMILFVAGPPELRNTIARWTKGSGETEAPVAPINMPGENESSAAVDESAPGSHEDSGDSSSKPPGGATSDVDETVTDDKPPRTELAVPRTELNSPDEDAGNEPPVPSGGNAPPLPSDLAGDDVTPGGTDTLGTNEMPADDNDVSSLDAGPPNPLRPNSGQPLDIGAAAGQEMGRYLTDPQVTLVYNRADNIWNRLTPKAIIGGGDRVLSLPAFRPAIALMNGVTIQTAGPALLDFEGFDDRGLPIVGIEFGRVTILTVGKAGNQLNLHLGDQHIVTTFGDAQSSLAIEVVGLLAPGADPEAGPPELAVDLYATSGQVRWQDASGEHVLKAPDHVSLTRQSAAGLSAGQLPDWATKDTTSMIDQKAAQALEKELSAERPLSLSINELAQNRRAEVRSLAIRCGGYMGQFEAYVSALNDPDQKASWPAHVETLRAALARGPQVASQVREALEKQRGQEAKSLYRMLWGYSADQLKKGDADILVDNLNHDSLDMRVLSFWNLQNITGLSLFYRPEYPAAKRKPQVMKWREKLKEGKVVPSGTPPGKVLSMRPQLDAVDGPPAKRIR